MNMRPGIWISLWLYFTGFLSALTAQDRSFQVVDFVDLPKEMDYYETDPVLKGSWYLEFHEVWIIVPQQRRLLKEVTGVIPGNKNAGDMSPDSLRQRFAGLIGRMAGAEGNIRVEDVRYEFILLDPHRQGAPDVGLSEADSLDEWTRELQGQLIELVKASDDPGKIFDLPDQMLSLFLDEDWTIDPETFQIAKDVTGISPVYWQRRRTTDGNPVNDAETGFPVYYRNVSSRIRLRNP